jgi:plastocyanin
MQFVRPANENSSLSAILLDSATPERRGTGIAVWVRMFKHSFVVTRYTLATVVALFAGGCGTSTNPSPTSPTNPEGTNPPNLLTITITNGVYSPNPLAVKVGQSVNWLNMDAFAHTATDSGVFDTGSIAPTSAHDVPVPFTTAGTYNYRCTLHANEAGSIVVTP